MEITERKQKLLVFLWTMTSRKLLLCYQVVQTLYVRFQTLLRECYQTNLQKWVYCINLIILIQAMDVCGEPFLGSRSVGR